MKDILFRLVNRQILNNIHCENSQLNCLMLVTASETLTFPHHKIFFSKSHTCVYLIQSNLRATKSSNQANTKPVH